MWRDWLVKRKGAIAISVALMALIALGSTLYAQVVKSGVDSLSQPAGALDWRAALAAPLALVALAFAKAGAMYVQTLNTNRLAIDLIVDLQNAMFEKLLAADFSRLAREPAGALQTRLTSDLQVLGESLIRAMNALVRDALIILGAAIWMILADWQLALVVLVLFPLMALPVRQIGRRLKRTSAAIQAQMGDLAGLLNESLGHPRLIKTYGLERMEGERAGKAFSDRRALLLKLARNRGQLEPILEALGGLAFGGVLAFAGFRIAQGQSSIGDLLGFVTALGFASGSMRSLGTLHGALQEGRAALERVFALLDETPQIEERPDAKPLTVGVGAVAFEGVRFSYPDQETAIAGLDLVLAPGRVTALVGPSGAGKSTIFNLLTRLYDVEAGRILIDGQDVRGVTLASLRAQIAIVSQEAVLFNCSIADNIAFGKPGASRQEIERAARAAAAHDFIQGLPQGYDTIAGPGGGKLSGGERQRIALARAILKDAPILLLDEATSALDAESERAVQTALALLSQNRTTLVIAHRLATVRNAHRIFAMDAGRIVESGNHEELMAKDGLYARLARLQFQEESHARQNGPS